MSPALHGSLLRAVIASSLRDAARSGESQDPPVAVLWADPDRTWETVIPQLQEAVPILLLGTWDAATAQGPALWIRAVLADPDAVALPSHLARRDPARPERTPWVLYLPGVHRHELTDLAQIPPHLAPLADIALRSSWWESPSSRSPWTPQSFLGAKYGASLDLARDAATHRALQEVLPRLLNEDVDALRHQGRLDADRLHARVMPDPVRTLLEWIDDPDATKERLMPSERTDDPVATKERVPSSEWTAFAHACTATYRINPDEDTNLTAAARLGAREGEWASVWDRFTEAPARYPGIPAALDQARPQSTLLDEDPHPDSWPSWNQEQEDELRTALAALRHSPDAASARRNITRLAATHASRRTGVWAELGRAPLAAAIALLADLAEHAGTTLTGPDLPGAIEWYAETGYRVDDLAVRALATVSAGPNLDAVRTALHAVYDPWVDQAARTFQALTQSAGYPGATGLVVEAGSCVLYVDALRLDLAHRLAERLPGHDVTVATRLAAFPTLTPTGQPAAAPVDAATLATWGGGHGFDAGDSRGRSLKGEVLRAALAASGVQLLSWSDGDCGDPTGTGWTAMNDIDAAGHATKGARFETVLGTLLDRVATRVTALLDAGWNSVVIVTDHGFLYPAHPAAKVELPLPLTEGESARKPRVARLRDGAPSTAFPTLPWTWDPEVRMVSAPGASAFEAGTRYEHGGLSPQECVIPVLTVTARLSPAERALVNVSGVRWTGQRCRIDITPPRTDVTVQIRTHPGNPGTAVVRPPKAPNDEGEVRLIVDEAEAAEGTDVHIVVLNAAGHVIAQHPTHVGGDR